MLIWLIITVLLTTEPVSGFIVGNEVAMGKDPRNKEGHSCEQPSGAEAPAEMSVQLRSEPIRP